MGVDHQRQASDPGCRQRHDAGMQHEVALDAVEPTACRRRPPAKGGVSQPAGQVIAPGGDHRGAQVRVGEPLLDESARGGPIGSRVAGGDHEEAHGL